MKLITFSPTGTGFAVGLEIAKAWNEIPSIISLYPSDSKNIVIKDDIAIIVVPVYSGRIPLAAENALKQIKAQNTPAITLVMYGNRDYDDALLELNDIAKEQGFNIVASAAFIGTHSLDQSIASNRPNTQDLTMAYNLGITVKANLEEFKHREITVKGNHPYKERKKFPYFTIADEKCTDCGLCAEKCPMQAISKDQLRTSDPTLCIGCMLCARDCPQQARHLNMPREQFTQFQLRLKEKCSGNKIPELIF